MSEEVATCTGATKNCLPHTRATQPTGTANAANAHKTAAAATANTTNTAAAATANTTTSANNKTNKTTLLALWFLRTNPTSDLPLMLDGAGVHVCAC